MLAQLSRFKVLAELIQTNMGSSFVFQQCTSSAQTAEIVPCGCYVGTSSVNFPSVCLAATSTIAVYPTMQLFRFPTTSIFWILPLLWRRKCGTGVIIISGVFWVAISTATFAPASHTTVHYFTARSINYWVNQKSVSQLCSPWKLESKNKSKVHASVDTRYKYKSLINMQCLVSVCVTHEY